MSEQDEALWKAQHEEMLASQDGSKYAGPDFNDPVVRCDDCNKLVHRTYIHKRGCCNHCGNRRVKNLQMFRGEEWESVKDGTYDFGVKDYKIDEEFLILFEEVADVEE